MIPSWTNLFLDTAPVPPEEYSLLRVSRAAMATRFEIAIPFGTPHALDAATDALDIIDDVETQLTVYRAESEVSQLNATAATRAVEAGASLFELLEMCATLTVETKGAFDVATGSLTKTWGFLQRAAAVPTPRDRAKAMSACGMKHVVLDPTRRTVKFRRPGLELNFGSIGKGYALDRAAECLRQTWGIRTALLHGGGSSVFALGTPPNSPRGWPIALCHPDDPEHNLGTVYLENQGLGTSAATYQHLLHAGKKLGHILDPRTGWPAEGTLSVSAIAQSAALADAYSTAMFVLGPSAAAEFCSAKPNLAAVVLPEMATTAIQYQLPADRYAPPSLRVPFWGDFADLLN